MLVVYALVSKFKQSPIFELKQSDADRWEDKQPNW